MSIQNAHAVVFLRRLGEAVLDTEIVREVILGLLGKQRQGKVGGTGLEPVTSSV